MNLSDSIVNAYDRAAPWYDGWKWQLFWNRNEIPHVRELIAQSSGAKRAIDIGTGTGRYVSMLRNQGVTAYGLDPSQEMLSVAATRLCGYEKLVHADACARVFADAYFDVAIAARVLCHIVDLHAAFREFARIVARGGRLIVTELDHDHDYETTRLPLEGGKLSVATWKRKPLELIDTAQRFGWRIDELRQIGAKECFWLPEPADLRSIDRSGARPIFNVISLRRI